MLAAISMPADANWLLSAIAQVTAAFVAIIGGFLLSRVLATSTERRGLAVQRQALDAHASVVRAERQRLDDELFRDDWVPWLQDVTYGIAGSRGAAGLDDALEAFPSTRSAEELRPVFEQAKALSLDALAYLEPAFQPDEPPPPEFEEIYDVDRLSDFQRISYWGAYVYLTNELAKKPSTFLIIPFSKPDPEPTRPEVEVDDRRARREKESRCDDLRLTERTLVEQLAGLDRVSARASVPGTKVAIGILAYLAGVGIVLPLSLMARLRTDLSSSAASTLVGLVRAGLLAVLAYASWLLQHKAD